LQFVATRQQSRGQQGNPEHKWKNALIHGNSELALSEPLTPLRCVRGSDGAYPGSGSSQ
jgi:hypothetical protein